MDKCCDLEVDVNGEGIFMVDKRILCSYSGRLRKMFSKTTNSKGHSLKVIFKDFPGGTEGFELVARFCYSGGSSVKICPSNIALAFHAAQFMEMEKSVSKVDNMLEQIEKSLELVNYYTWSDLLLTLKQIQDLSLHGFSHEIILKMLDSLILRIALAGVEASPCPSTSSPESNVGFRISCDSRSTESLKTSCTRASWWVEDLLVLNLDSVQIAVKLMVSRKLNHAWIGRFLLYYQKAKFVNARADEKCEIMEKIIDMLCSLDRCSVSCKSLFGLVRVALGLDINKRSRARLEGMIGSRLDEASLDNLLVPAPYGVNSFYDVNLVLRFLRSFFNRGACQVPRCRMNKVAELVDYFLAEVAPDPYLKPSKLVALSMALPDCARESYDDMYHALDMYLMVHPGLSEEERLNICCVLNYEKLSAEACLHLAHNKKFPSRSAVQALICRQGKLKDLHQDANHIPRSCYASPFSHHVNRSTANGVVDHTEVVPFSGILEVSTENDKLKAQLQGMQWRVKELEKVCKKMQTQMTKMVKSSPRSSGGTRSKSLPKLCS